METRTQENLARAELGTLISSRRVEGTDVYNSRGDHLGTIEHVMIDKLTGQVSYAVMSFGGFLGIGEKYHPLPWQVLEYDTSKGGYIVEAFLPRLPQIRARLDEDVDAAFRSDPAARSYGEIAKQIGKPTAFRAVGAANGRNPISIIAPCHRVIGSTGKLTGFAGGLAAKEHLLGIERGKISETAQPRAPRAA